MKTLDSRGLRCRCTIFRVVREIRHWKDAEKREFDLPTRQVGAL